MAQTKPKVVPFSPAGKPKFARQKSEPHGRVLSECRSVYSTHTMAIHRDFFDKVDDELFTLSDKAESSTLQSLYFDSMRFVRKERDKIQVSYIDSALQQYDDFWVKGKGVDAPVPVQESDEDSFSLIENEALEEDLAITTMVDKGQKLFYTELYALDRRFAALLGLEYLDRDENPISPNQICHRLEHVIKPLDLELEIKLVIYKLYDRVVLCKLGDMYKALNATLVTHGVLAKLPKHTKRNSVPAGGLSSNVGFAPGDLGNLSEFQGSQGFGNQQHVAETAAELQIFQSLQSLLGGWRNQSQITSPFEQSAYTGPTFETNEVLNLLSLMQRGGPDQNRTQVQTGQQLKLYVSNELNRMQAGNEARPIGALEEDVIDMVAMIFDFILDDKHLPDPVKALISRLQIPIVKAAVLEKSFFAKKSHPARELLNSLARAGAGLDNQSCESNPVFAEIESVVGRVLKEFEKDMRLFSELLAEFSAFMEKDDQRSRIIEERTRQVTESKEQLQIAKSKVAYEIASCMQGKELPVVVRSFLDDTWKDVMLLACLRKDKEPKGWENSLDIASRLVRSVLPIADGDARKQVLREIPRLIKDIRVGLENISFDPHRMSMLFKDFEACHVAALSASAKEQSSQSRSVSEQYVGTGESASEKTVISTVRDPELAAEIESLASSLPNLDESLFSTVGKSKDELIENYQIEEIVMKSVPVQEPVKEVRDEFVEQAEALEVGQWLSFKNDIDEPVKAKLSWKSPMTSLCVFVNRKGVKTAEKTIAELASDLRKGKVVTLENPTVPVMDRALAAMMTTLQVSKVKEGLPA